MQGLFITGTDTGVGKTVTACLIAEELRRTGLRVGCYKPVCSGSDLASCGERRWSDVDALWKAMGETVPPQRVCPQRFHAPLAPPSAARLEGRQVDAALLRQGAAWWSGHVDVLLVEGVGGLLCPIANGETVADLAGDLGFPLIIVSALRLGAINHTLLTIDVARQRGLHIGGLVFNDLVNGSADVNESTLEELRQRTTVSFLGMIPYNEQERVRPFGDANQIDWMSIARPAGAENRSFLRQSW